MIESEAWDTTMGDASIVIAITDDGVDWDHPDLAANIWTNPGETPGNYIDDDANGYVDDVRGWDFSSNDNDPNHVGSHSHGTHVAGITAARTDNGTGVAGTAGHATIMPLRFYGSGAWTSTIIAETFSNGQVQIGAGDFTFYIRNGWLIEGGRITAPIKDVNIIGNGPQTLRKRWV